MKQDFYLLEFMKQIARVCACRLPQRALLK